MAFNSNPRAIGFMTWVTGLAALAVTSSTWAGEGDLDPNFGQSGLASVNFEWSSPVDSRGEDIVVLDNGKILTVGEAMVIESQVCLAQWNPNGTLDTSFGDNGTVVTRFSAGSRDSATSVAIQSDGKIVVAGSSSPFCCSEEPAVARYHADGTLDTSFGDGGLVVTPLGGAYNDNPVESLAIQSDGKILLAIKADLDLGTREDWGLIRYNADGSLDTGFGVGGLVFLDVTGNGETDRAYDIALQSDGKIVVGGYSDRQFALARFDTQGALDPTFGVNGIVLTSHSSLDWIRGLAVRSDGKIVCVGSVDANSSLADLAVLRYNADGSLDPTLGGSGIVTFDIAGDSDQGLDIALTDDDRMVASGYATIGFQTDFATLVLLEDGTLDSTFDGDGIATTDFNGQYDDGQRVALQADGKVLVVGTAASADQEVQNLSLIRYDTDGSLDTTFDGDGRASASFIGPSEDYLEAMDVQWDGKIVTAGSTMDRSSARFALVRWNRDGTLDASFGVGGRVATKFGDSYAGANAMAIQADGKIVAVGSYEDDSGGGLAMARYLRSGSLDPSFDGDGQLTMTLGDYASARAIAIQRDGRILIGGTTESFGDDVFLLARFLSDGTLDASFGTGGIVTTQLSAGRNRIRAMALTRHGDIIVAGDVDRELAVACYSSVGLLKWSDTPIDSGPDGRSGGQAVALQADGKIVVSGYVRGSDYETDMAAVRYSSDGSLDTGFGSGGISVVGVVNIYERASALFIAPCGRIVLGGEVEMVEQSDFGIAVLHPDGSLDTDFQMAGWQTTDFQSSRDQIESLTIVDGKILAAGAVNIEGDDFGLARYSFTLPRLSPPRRLDR